MVGRLWGRWFAGVVRITCCISGKELITFKFQSERKGSQICIIREGEIFNRTQKIDIRLHGEWI